MHVETGTDTEINQGGGWLRFQVGSFFHIIIMNIIIAAKFKDMKWGVWQSVSLACLVCFQHALARGVWGHVPPEKIENLPS